VHTTEHDDAGEGIVVYTSLAQSDAETLRDGGSRCNLKITIGDVDLPAFISDGKLYVQAPLRHVFEAFAEDLSDFVRDMEIRVSGPRGATLSLDSDGRPFPGTTVALTRMVRGSRKRR
jgi:hypothetical protein